MINVMPSNGESENYRNNKTGNIQERQRIIVTVDKQQLLHICVLVQARLRTCVWLPGSVGMYARV
jgi:hypothetical protein